MCNQGGGYIDQWRVGGAGKTRLQGQTYLKVERFLENSSQGFQFFFCLVFNFQT